MAQGGPLQRRKKLNTEMFLESELESLEEYLHGYCENPLENASDDLKEILAPLEDDRFNLQWALETAFSYGVMESGFAPIEEASLVLPIGEIEVETALLDEDCLDDWVVQGELAYYAVNAAVFYYDLEKLKEFVADWKEMQEEER